MVKYSRGIAVQSLHRGSKPQRCVNIGADDSTIPNSSYLSDFDLHSINEIIVDLTKLLDSKGSGFIWGQEQMMIDSSPEISYCRDELYGDILDEVPTNSLLNLMIEIQKIKEMYQNSVNLKKIIGEVYTIVKSNPNNYRRWPNSNTDFVVTINDVYVSLFISPEDFELTENEFVNQLQTDFN